MNIISIVNQKGGSGKTTLALHLAVAASQAGLNTAVIDLDPQASAANWGDRRKDKLPHVRPAFASRLPQELNEIRKAGGEIVVIDTAPASDSAALAAAQASDFILIPCRPSYFDLESMANTLGLLKTTGKPVWAVLNAVTSQGSEAEAAAETIKALDVRLCPVQLGRRVAYSRAVESGQAVQETEPRSKAAEEVERLYRAISRALQEG